MLEFSKQSAGHHDTVSFLLHSVQHPRHTILLFSNYFQPDFGSCYDSVLLGSLHLNINRGKIPISFLFGNSSTSIQNMLNPEYSSPRSGSSSINCSSMAPASHLNSQSINMVNHFSSKTVTHRFP